MCRIRPLALAVLIPATLAAQQPASDRSANNVRASFSYFAAHYGNLLVAALESIPATKYAYRPTPQQQSVGYIAQHLEDANYGLCVLLGKRDPRAAAEFGISDSVRATWPKDTLVARVRSSLTFCEDAIAKLNDAQLGKLSVAPTDPGREVLRPRVLLAFTTDLAEHYAQLASYMRQLGLVPPSAPPPRKDHVAIDVPASILSSYVGKYQLAPGFAGVGAMLDVHLRGGALYLTPSGQREVRLWPETRADFFLQEIDIQVTFTRDANGVVTGLVVHQGGEDQVGTKLK